MPAENQAAREVRRENALVLFGVEPSEAHTDYGWISLGPAASASGLRPVTSFVEKPERGAAARLFAGGAVWNTMVIVARARALWELYVERLPEMADVFSRAFQHPLADHYDFLAEAYANLAPKDFSRDVLTVRRGFPHTSGLQRSAGRTSEPRTGCTRGSGTPDRRLPPLAPSRPHDYVGAAA